MRRTADYLNPLKAILSSPFLVHFKGAAPGTSRKQKSIWFHRCKPHRDPRSSRFFVEEPIGWLMWAYENQMLTEWGCVNFLLKRSHSSYAELPRPFHVHIPKPRPRQGVCEVSPLFLMRLKIEVRLTIPDDPPLFSQRRNRPLQRLYQSVLHEQFR